MNAGNLILDVSNNNPISEHDLRTANPIALICKGTEGDFFKDGTLQQHRSLAKLLDIPFGAYIFLRAKSPGNEAKFFLDYVKPRNGDIQPIIDAEYGGLDKGDYAQMAERVVLCANAFKQRGYDPILYTSYDFWTHLFAVKPEIKWMRVWEAQYPGKFTKWFPKIAAMRLRLRHGATVVMWQWTDMYVVNGKYFDASRLLVDIDSLLLKRSL